MADHDIQGADLPSFQFALCCLHRASEPEATTLTSKKCFVSGAFLQARVDFGAWPMQWTTKRNLPKGGAFPCILAQISPKQSTRTIGPCRTSECLLWLLYGTQLTRDVDYALCISRHQYSERGLQKLDLCCERCSTNIFAPRTRERWPGPWSLVETCCWPISSLGPSTSWSDQHLVCDRMAQMKIHHTGISRHESLIWRQTHVASCWAPGLESFTASLPGCVASWMTVFLNDLSIAKRHHQ